jgi:hypothetical protein
MARVQAQATTTLPVTPAWRSFPRRARGSCGARVLPTIVSADAESHLPGRLSRCWCAGDCVLFRLTLPPLPSARPCRTALATAGCSFNANSGRKSRTSGSLWQERRVEALEFDLGSSGREAPIDGRPFHVSVMHPRSPRRGACRGRLRVGPGTSDGARSVRSRPSHVEPTRVLTRVVNIELSAAEGLFLPVGGFLSAPKKCREARHRTHRWLAATGRADIHWPPSVESAT